MILAETLECTVPCANAINVTNTRRLRRQRRNATETQTTRLKVPAGDPEHLRFSNE